MSRSPSTAAAKAGEAEGQEERRQRRRPHRRSTSASLQRRCWLRRSPADPPSLDESLLSCPALVDEMGPHLPGRVRPAPRRGRCPADHRWPGDGGAADGPAGKHPPATPPRTSAGTCRSIPGGRRRTAPARSRNTAAPPRTRDDAAPMVRLSRPAARRRRVAIGGPVVSDEGRGARAWGQEAGSTLGLAGLLGTWLAQLLSECLSLLQHAGITAGAAGLCLTYITEL